MINILKYKSIKFKIKKPKQQGVSAIEFILALPIVLAIFIFFADASSYFILKQKNARQAFVISDLLSTQPNISFVPELKITGVNSKKDIFLINKVLVQMGINIDNVSYNLHWVDLLNTRIKYRANYKGKKYDKPCGSTKTDIRDILPSSIPLKINGSVIAIDFCQKYDPKPYIFFGNLLGTKIELFPSSFESGSISLYRGSRE